MSNTHRTITTTFAATMGLLALTACPDDGEGNETETTTEGTETGDTTAPGTTDDETDTTGDSTQGATESSGDDSTSTGEPASLLELILDSVGGEEALDGLAQVQLQTTGNRFVLDEGPTPGGPALPASEFETTVSVDFEGAGLRLDISRDLQFIPIGVPLTVSEIVSGNLGYIDGLESIFGMPLATDMLSDRWASTVKQQRLLNPHLLLKDLLADPSTASDAGTADFEGTEYRLLEVADDVFPVTLWFDPAAGEVTRLTTMENTHLHRDTELEIRYLDWQDTADGVRFPGQAQLWLGGSLIHDELRSAIATNPGLDATTFALPPESMASFDPEEAARGRRTHQHNQIFASIGIPQDGLQTAIDAAEIAPGVHFLGGGTHHSMVIEQAGGVVVLEAPLYPQRCEAILEWVDTNLMAPVTHVVLSHHHEDHSSCARVFVAAGATLVVHEAAEAYFGDVLAAPSTIEPDRLENEPVMNPQIAAIPSGGSLTLDDGANPITVFELASTHADDLVFPMVESAGIVFVVDVFSPGLLPNPFGAQEVLAAFDTWGVTEEVTTIVGGHGFGFATVADVEAIAGM